MRHAKEKEDKATSHLNRDYALEIKDAQEHDTAVDKGSCIK